MQSKETHSKSNDVSKWKVKGQKRYVMQTLIKKKAGLEMLLEDCQRQRGTLQNEKRVDSK